MADLQSSPRRPARLGPGESALPTSLCTNVPTQGHPFRRSDSLPDGREQGVTEQFDCVSDSEVCRFVI